RLCPRGPRSYRQCERACSQMQKLPSVGKFHGDLPETIRNGKLPLGCALRERTRGGVMLRLGRAMGMAARAALCATSALLSFAEFYGTNTLAQAVQYARVYASTGRCCARCGDCACRWRSRLAW